MLPELSPLDHTIWILTAILQIGLLTTVFVRRLLPELFTFHAYLIFSLARSVGLLAYGFFCHPSTQMYYLWSWRLTGIGFLFQATLAAQIVAVCASQPVNRAVFLFAEAFAAGELLTILTAQELSLRPVIMLNLLAAGVTGGLLLLALSLRPMDWTCHTVAWGLVALMLVSLPVGVYRLHNLWGHWQVVSRIEPLARAAVLTCWWIMFSLGRKYKHSLTLKETTGRVGRVR